MVKPYLTDAQIKQGSNKLFSALQSELIDQGAEVEFEKKDDLGKERFIKQDSESISCQLHIHDEDYYGDEDFSLICLGGTYSIDEVDELAEEIRDHFFW